MHGLSIWCSLLRAKGHHVRMLRWAFSKKLAYSWSASAAPGLRPVLWRLHGSLSWEKDTCILVSIVSETISMTLDKLFYFSEHQFLYLPTYFLSVHPSIYPSTHPYFLPPIHSFVQLPIHPSLCPSVHLLNNSA